MESSYAKDAVTRPGLGDPIRQDGPITQEVLEALARAQDMANEIRHRLYTLRDRLVGSPPPEGPQASGSKGDAPHFKAAHSERSASLISTLVDIDSLSNEINTRL